MKILTLLLPFVISCSLTNITEKAKEAAEQRKVSRNISSIKKIRIVKLNEEEKSYNFVNTKKVEFELKVYRFSFFALKNRPVDVIVKEGSGKLTKTSYKTDKKGKIRFTYLLPQKIESTHIEFHADGKRVDYEFEVTRPEKYVGDFSVEKSDFIVDRKNFKANGEEFATFKFYTKDSKGSKVKAFAQEVVLHGESTTHDMREVSLGVYEAKVRLGKKSGPTMFEVSVNDKKKSQTITLNLEQVVDSNSIDLNVENEGSHYRVCFNIEDLYGEIYKKIESIKPVVNEGLSLGEIKFDPNKEQYYYDIKSPRESLDIEAGIELNGKKFLLDENIKHTYIPADPKYSKITFDRERVIPTGVDFFTAQFEIRDENSQLASFDGLPQVKAESAKVYELKKLSEGLYQAYIAPEQGAENIEVSLHINGKLISKKKAELSFKPFDGEISTGPHFLSGMYFQGLNYGIHKGESFGKNMIIGTQESFSITNRGGNSAVPSQCAPAPKGNSGRCKPQRGFQLEFRDQVKQNMELYVTDQVNEYTSHTMHTQFVFFPRKVIPSIKIVDGNKEVILPTGEKVIFSGETGEIIDGVLEEGEMDIYTKSRHSRKFADLRYKGSGVVVRANGRGQTPGQGQFNNSQIRGEFGNIGGKGALIYKYDQESGKVLKCIRPKSDFWVQEDISPVPFKFVTDEDFDEYLKRHCKFSLFE